MRPVCRKAPSVRATVTIALCLVLSLLVASCGGDDTTTTVVRTQTVTEAGGATGATGGQTADGSETAEEEPAGPVSIIDLLDAHPPRVLFGDSIERKGTKPATIGRKEYEDSLFLEVASSNNSDTAVEINLEPTDRVFEAAVGLPVSQHDVGKVTIEPRADNPGGNALGEKLTMRPGEDAQQLKVDLPPDEVNRLVLVIKPSFADTVTVVFGNPTIGPN